MSLVAKGFAILLAIGAAMPVAAAGKEPADVRKLREDLTLAVEKAQQDDCRSSLQLIERSVDQPSFAGLTTAGQAGIREIAMNCALMSNDMKVAYRHALAGTQLDAASVGQWTIRFALEMNDGRYVQALNTIESMAARKPEALNAVELRALYNLLREVGKLPDPLLKRRLLVVLTAPSYQPDEVLADSDGFRRAYAAMLADDGDKAGAAAQVARISSSSELIGVSLDLRLRALLPAGFDGRAAVERDLAQARDVAVSHAGSLRVVLVIASYLRQLGRAEEGLVTLEAARPDGPQAAAFTDLDETRNWWWDAMARSYEMLGRYDDAVAAFRGGIDAREVGGLNVSQTINLGHTQLRFGRPAEALRTVAAFENGDHAISDYGRMEMRLVRGCARLAMQQAEAAREDLTYAAAHEKDHPEATMDLQLCAGDMDAAAGTAIRGLDDPERRGAMLMLFSDFDPPPSTYPATAFETGAEALKMRPDVKAAIARAGGTRRFRLRAGGL